jgi:hypothetical protein
MEHLRECGFLVPVGSAAAPPVIGIFADVLRHAEMLSDDIRVSAYRRALEVAAPGQRVLDLGTGSGVLSVLAARAGAREVIAIEETAVADIAAQVFAAAEIDVVLMRRSSRDVELDQPVDVSVHEIFGNDPLAEGVLPTISDARRRLLAPGGVLVPHRLEIVCVGVDTRGQGHDREAALAALARVEGVGTALAPLAAVIAALPPRAFVTDLGDVPFEVLTEPLLLHDLDLTVVDEDACAAPVHGELVVTHPGRLDAIVTYFRAHLGGGIVLTNAPDAPRTHWERRVTTVSASCAVLPGARIAIAAWREANLKHEQLIVDLAG